MNEHESNDKISEVKAILFYLPKQKKYDILYI